MLHICRVTILTTLVTKFRETRIHTNYLKLVSGTSLKEDKNNGTDYDGNQSDSSYEEEEDYAKDLDYSEESISEEYASVVHSEDLSDVRANETNQTNKVNETEEENSDANADKLVETFCSQSLVDVNVTSDFNNAIESLQLLSRGRGRGTYNKKGGRQQTRRRGGRYSKQSPVSQPQDKQLSNSPND